MKIGILTFHRADNYGALLQVYALQKKMVSMGCEAEVINYKCEPIDNSYIYHYFPDLKKNIFSYFVVLLKNMVVVRQKKMRGYRCEEFRNNKLTLSPLYQSDDERSAVQKIYDLIITGSDQIWSVTLTGGKDDWYCFKKENDALVVTSYGASVGNLELFKNHFSEFENDLNNYRYISVREQEVKEYLDHYFAGKVIKTIDPTFLLSRKEWEELSNKALNKRNEKYILYYDVDKNNESKRISIALSKKLGCKLIHFDDGVKMLLRGGYTQKAGPIEFIDLIRGAEFIVTSSFHATAFSIIFEKDFLVVPHPRTGARVRDLLTNLGLSDRICNSYADYLTDGIKKAEYGPDMKMRLDNEIATSVEYLKNCMKEVSQ